MRILVITSCTSSKAVRHPEQLALADFQHPDRLATRRQALRSTYPELELPAAKMYTGRQHAYVLAGLERLRSALEGQATVNLRIVSAGYGLLDEHDLILPYEATFTGMRRPHLLDYSRRVLHLPESIQAAVRGFDLSLFLLGETYLRAIGLPLEVKPNETMVFIAGTAVRSWFPRAHAPGLVCLSSADAKALGGGQVGLKGQVLKRIGEAIAATTDLTERLAIVQGLAQDPGGLRRLLGLPEEGVEVPRRSRPRQAQIPLPFVAVPEGYMARNAGPRPRFFVPDWDDLVDPDYDFLQDAHPGGAFDPHEQGVYAHEIFGGSAAYDGILVSRAVVDDSNEKKRSRFDHVHEFLRWPRPRPVMGDCGAFSYLNKLVPPYSTDDVLEYYERHGFDLGVSVDHLIVGGLPEEERDRRFQLTLDNAQEFLQKHRAGSYRFTPMGVAQGWNNDTYRDAVDALLQMGYRHIALGGLAFDKSQAVVELLAHISPLFPEGLYVHLFGLAREELLAPYARFGVTAFDSATFLRRAWMSDRDNYLDSQSAEWYTAIRIPPSRFEVHGKSNGKSTHQVRVHRQVKALVEAGKCSLQEVELLERQALVAVRTYATNPGPTRLADALQALLRYDELMLPNRDLKKLGERYATTLTNRPWERCPCPICRALGVEVVIFRSNDRNRRRGFHNSYAFRRLEEARWKELVGDVGST